MKLHMRLDRIINLKLQEHMGFGISQFRILIGLQLRPEMTQKDIADFWNITEASVSRQVKILEKQHWLVRTSRIAITPLGTKTIEKARAVIDEIFEKIFINVDDKKRKAAATLLESLLEELLKTI